MRRRVVPMLAFGLASISVMAFIFSFSSQDSATSSSLSDHIATAIAQVFVPGFQEQTEQVQMELAGSLTFAIRKTAHMAEYAVLSLCVSGFVWNVSWVVRGRAKRFETALVAAMVTCFYSCTDEFHQMFVYGRSGEFRDVIVDAVGISIGIAIAVKAVSQNSSSKDSG